MYSCVVHDLLVEMLVLSRSRQSAINKEVSRLQMVRFLRKLLYGISSVPQNAIRPVNVCDIARNDCSVQKPTVEHAQTAFSFVFLRFIVSGCFHLLEGACVDGVLSDRDFIGLSCTVVAHRERILLGLKGHYCENGECRMVQSLGKGNKVGEAGEGSRIYT